MNYQARTVPMITENLLGYVAEPYRTGLRPQTSPPRHPPPPPFVISASSLQISPLPNVGLASRLGPHSAHPTGQSPSSWKTRK